MGQMEQLDGSTKIAGVDVGKFWLDAALAEPGAPLRVRNDAAGIGTLADWLQQHGVGRVGLEASGPYDRPVRHALQAAGLAVVLHQPAEVKLFGRLKRQRAKNDRLDARLIAAATAGIERPARPADPRLAELAEWLTVYEHVAATIAGLKTLLESVSLDALRHCVLAQIDRLKAGKAELAATVMAAITAQPDLRQRLGLLMSLPGFGPIVATSMLIRMPELGDMQHGQPACMIGVAPHDRDSGTWHGTRCITGGRSRPRRMLYIAALAARRCDPDLKAFADRLEQHGKPKKLILVAIMRKLIEAANIVLKRKAPWIPKTAK
jgi:transposase